MVVEKQSLIRSFRERFPGSGGVRVVRAPGRVNLIGEHTDYNLGWVCPIAIDLACHIAWSHNEDGVLRLWSANVREMREFPVARLQELEPARHWSDYVAGVARELALLNFSPEPANLFIHSTVPTGAGLSSSAALELSSALALLSTRTVAAPAPPLLEIVKLCRRAENDFVGMPCGIMDQFVSAFAREGAAIAIDCRSLEHTPAPLPAGVKAVAVNSMVKHELGQSAYPQRVAQCREAVSILQRKHPEISSLRDARMEYLSDSGLDGVPLKRARHVVSEDERVAEFIGAASSGDLKRMGELFVASHRSLQHDYEVSCEELDFLVDNAIALPGVWGARMTGGGFGGCTVNLVAEDAVGAFEESISRAYRGRYGLTPQFYACSPADGACEL
jgi:galactokinase